MTGPEMKALIESHGPQAVSGGKLGAEDYTTGMAWINGDGDVQITWDGGVGHWQADLMNAAVAS
jgi:hypothetical protein